MQQIRLFCDMDGTLVKWLSSSSFELYQKDYFRNIEPNQNLLTAIKQICLSENDTLLTHILSSYLTDSLYARDDKDAWNTVHIPEIPPERRIYVPYGIQKSHCVPGGIRPTDILLDDFTVNLLDWSKHAIGVKCLNGINHTNQTWNGFCISTADHPDVIQADLLRIINSLKE